MIAIAALSGALGMFATKAAFEWGLAGSRGHGWLIAAAVGVVVALCVLRAGRERMVPLEENPVSRVIAAAYGPALRWVLGHKKTFMAVPLLILLTGLTVWLGVHRTLYPVEWAANRFAKEKASRRSSAPCTRPPTLT